MTARCSNCKFWTRWAGVRVGPTSQDKTVTADIGHCVIERRIDANIVVNHVQGLTGEDFYCQGYKERAANE